MSQREVAIVTGGTYGIGRAITVTLARRGFAVVAFGLDARQMGSTAELGSSGTKAELEAGGFRADVLEADVSRAADIQRVVAFAIGTYGRIDVLVNNAAIRPHGRVVDTTEDVWDRVIDVNLKGMFLSTRAVVPHMIRQGGGAIVNIGSASGWGRPNRLAYSASKGGVFGLSAALAYDHLHDHIRVNVVVPGGAVVTGMTEDNPERLALAAGKTVSARNVTPQDVANAVAFLVSDEAEQITGAVLNVGGFALQSGGGPNRALEELRRLAEPERTT